ncbi:hypothetical protein [Streptomyces sp. SAI-229]
MALNLVRRPVTAVTTTAVAAMGSTSSPARDALIPRPSCIHCV